MLLKRKKNENIIQNKTLTIVSHHHHLISYRSLRNVRKCKKEKILNGNANNSKWVLFKFLVFLRGNGRKIKKKFDNIRNKYKRFIKALIINKSIIDKKL